MTQTQNAELQIAITRVIRASPERVFDAWTDPSKIARWFGPDGYTTTTHEFDLRPGGLWLHTMRGPDGTDYQNRIEFVEVERPRRLVYDHHSTPRFRTTVAFEPEGDGQTRMSFRMVFADADGYRTATEKFGAREGAKQTLARLAGFVEQPGAPTLVAARRTYWPPVTVERVFRAPVEKVWKMWTTKEGLETWYWPEPLAGTVRKLDLRPGGQWEIGAAGLDHTSRGTFSEVAPNRRLCMVASIDFIPGVEAYDRVDIVEFEPVAKGTKMTFTASRMHSDEWQLLADGGWGSSLDKLQRALETGEETSKGFVIERTFKAPPEKVWRMWTTKEGIEKWWAVSARDMGYEMAVRELDVRQGGKFAFELVGNGHHLVNGGTYTLVQPFWELGWTWHYDIFLAPDEKPYDVPIFISFAKAPGGGTKMTFVQGPLASPDYTEGSRQGVLSNFEKLAKALGE